MYASRLRGDPGEMYRQVDANGRVGQASPHALVTVLYDDLLRALRLAALACDRGDVADRSARVTKAVALLFALEAGLDFTRGGGVADALSRFYRGARDSIMRASLAGDGDGLRDAAASIGEIADSWRQIAPA